MTRPRLTQEIVDYLMSQELIHTSGEYFYDGESDLRLYVRINSIMPPVSRWEDKRTGMHLGSTQEATLDEARKRYKELLAERIKKMQEEIEG